MANESRRGVPYKELLSKAHEAGLKSIEAELFQVPTAENGMVAICKARVENNDGQIFRDVGDADPANVGRNIVPHIIRMAATRAKARCLRDMLQYGEVAIEELGPDFEDDATEMAPPRQASRPAPPQEQRGAAKNVPKQPEPTGTATKSQLSKLKWAMQKAGEDPAYFYDIHGASLPELSSEDADSFIQLYTEQAGIG